METLFRKKSSTKGTPDVSTDDTNQLAQLPKLTQDQIRRITQDSPEFITLLDDYTLKVKELRSDIQPTLLRLREHKEKNGEHLGKKSAFELTQGISFLQLKFQTLLSYVTNMFYYLLLKTEGKDVTDHPVITRLVEMRIILEKIRPIDKQLKYQIEKLLKAGAMAGARPKADTEDDEYAVVDEEKDLLTFKPNLSGMVRGEMKKGGDDDDDQQDESDQESHAGRKRSTALHGGLSSTSFEMEERKANKALQLQKKLQNKLSTSKLVEEMRRELSERPEEENTYGMAGFKVAQIDKEREQFEEEHYMRLMETKDTRRRRKNAEKIGSFDEFDDFADLSQIARLDMDNKRSRKSAPETDAFDSLRNRRSDGGEQNERSFRRQSVDSFEKPKKSFMRGKSTKRGGKGGKGRK